MFPSVDLVSATKSLTVESSNFAKVGAYTIRLTVFYASQPANSYFQDFIIDVIDYCTPTTVSTTSL